MISITSLNYAYSKKKKILTDISCTLRPGHIYGLLGLNGEGKTTLIKLMAAMLLPNSGQICFGTLQSNKRSAEYFNEVFFLPDSSKLPDLPIEKFGSLYGLFYSRYNHEEYIDYLKAFNIPIENGLSALSLGQQRKVHIAFALACNCSVLLMDEPTNGLDIPSKTIFRKLISKSMNEQKLYVISSHQIRDIDQLLDALLILHQRKLIVNSSLQQLAQSYKISTELQPQEEVIYTEHVFEGHKHLVKSTSNEENPVDIEFLFNAFTHANQPIAL